jgi:CheY-like chemotaxis protein
MTSQTGGRERTDRRIRVLLVEDDKSVQVVTISMLEICGYDVTAVEHAHQVFASLEHERPIDLIITDHRKGGVNGMELAKEIKRRNARIPVVLLSGGMRRPSSLPIGIASVVMKPFTLQELEIETRRALGKVVFR